MKRTHQEPLQLPKSKSYDQMKTTAMPELLPMMPERDCKWQTLAVAAPSGAKNSFIRLSQPVFRFHYRAQEIMHTIQNTELG